MAVHKKKKKMKSYFVFEQESTAVLQQTDQNLHPVRSTSHKKQELILKQRKW